MQLARVLLSSKPGPTLGLLRAKVKSYGHGELPHAEHVLPALYELMESDESVEETPLPAAALPNKEATGGDWEGLKRALTSSLTSGTFLDSQFYAAESKSSTGLPKVRPIYFCSTVAGSFASKLVARKSPARVTRGWVTDPSFQIRRKSEHGEHHLLDVRMGMTVILMTKILTRRAPQSATLIQSCTLIPFQFITANLVCFLQCPRKSYGHGLTDRVRTSVEIRSGKDVSHRLRWQYDLLTSWCSWSATLLYVYTGQITFANLSSQDVTTSEKEEAQGGCSQGERNSPQDPEGLNAPPPSTFVVEPCSPKSVYSLATKVCLAPLRSDAIIDSSFV